MQADLPKPQNPFESYLNIDGAHPQLGQSCQGWNFKILVVRGG